MNGEVYQLDRSVRVLMYHSVIRAPLKVPDWCFLDVEFFYEQIRYLKKHFDILSLTDAVARLRERSVHRPIAVITFDDGFRDNYKVVFPILRAENVPATIYLVTGLIGTDQTLWFCQLNRALANTTANSLEWNGVQFELSTIEDKEKASKFIQRRLKDFPPSQLLFEMQTILHRVGETASSAIEEDSPFRILNRDEISEMVSSGLIEIGAHTQSHSILNFLNYEQRIEEIQKSLTLVSEVTGRTCRHFAYPNGRKQDYDQECIRILQGLGVESAVTAIEGNNDLSTPLLELRRYGVGPHLSMDDFIEMMTQTELSN